MSQEFCYNYGNVKLGFGNFNLPPILIGTMFYQGQTIVNRKEEKIFDKEKAIKRINLHKALATQYKLPELIEISATSSEAMLKYLEFYLDIYDPPFVLGGTYEARVAGVQYLRERGLSPDDYIYNSISNLKNKNELEFIKKNRIHSAVLLILGSSSMSSTQRYSYITENNQPGNINILEGLKRYGIERILVDGGVIDIESLAHIIETQQMISSSLQLPVGTAPTLFLFKYSSPRLNERFHTKYRKASIIFITSWFSNFIFYGAIEDAKACFSSTYQALEFKKTLKTHHIRLIENL
jgi:tetrahydromethanopterin S-methyltransferase subunit H